MSPASFGSTIFSRLPFLLHCIAQSARFTCSRGSDGFSAGRAQRASRRTTPKEYTSDFSVNCCFRKYSGSRSYCDVTSEDCTCAWPGPSLDRPKSAIFAMKLSSRRMLVVLTSR